FERVREQNKNARAKDKFITINQARENKFQFEWNSSIQAIPSFTGNKVFREYPLQEIAKFIDWTPFFHSWEMKGSYPKIFNDPERGVEAKKLFDDAQLMLEKIIREKWLTANGVVGI